MKLVSGYSELGWVDSVDDVLACMNLVCMSLGLSGLSFRNFDYVPRAWNS